MKTNKSFAGFAMLLAMTLGFALAASAQQTELPRPTQQVPLQRRIADYESPNRDKIMKPTQVLRALALKNGDVVADIGAGSGYFSRKFARAVAPKGKVYAVDIDAEILAYLRRRAQKERLRNIDIVLSTPNDPMLPPNSLNLAFFSETIHHIKDRPAFYRKVGEALKPHGRMAIIDFVPGGPAAPFHANELVPVSQDKQEAAKAEFKFVREYNFLQPNYYFLIFEKE